jgi:hypothetical protein
MKTHEIHSLYFLSVVLNSLITGIYNKVERISKLNRTNYRVKSSTTFFIRSIGKAEYSKFVFENEIIKNKKIAIIY